jgi:NADPH:quinone reductase-like Zn-dependent oxidoreductase
VDPSVLGLEFAGEVIEGSPLWPVGSQVMGICAGEAYSERVVAHERALMPIPSQLSWEEAAAFPEAYLTAFDALERAQLKAGERLLVHAIGSGVGCAVARIGAYLGAEVVGTTRTPWKRERALERLPVSTAVTLEEGDFSPLSALSSQGFGEGFDVVVDLVGAAYLKQNIKALRERGRLVVVGLLGGVKGELPLGLLLARRASVYGTVLRSRPLEEKISLTQEVTRRLLPALERGVLAPPEVHECFEASPQGVEQAHGLMASGALWSKLVCVW